MTSFFPQIIFRTSPESYVDQILCDGLFDWIFLVSYNHVSIWIMMRNLSKGELIFSNAYWLFYSLIDVLTKRTIVKSRKTLFLILSPGPWRRPWITTVSVHEWWSPLLGKNIFMYNNWFYYKINDMTDFFPFRIYRLE